jgi:flagellar protein FlaH
MKILSLGIKDLDKSIGGGFPYPSLASIEGDFGSGKTALTQQIVYSALKAGLRVCVITSETTVKEYLAMMKSIKLDPYRYYINSKMDMYALHVEGGKWSKFLSSLFFKVTRNFLEVYKDRYDLIVIDSLSVLAVDTPPHVFLTFITRMKNLVSDGKTIILTYHPNFLPENSVMKLKASSDVYLTISNAKVAGVQVKVLKIVKLWGTTGDRKSSVSLEINPHMGLRVLPLGGVKV